MPQSSLSAGPSSSSPLLEFKSGSAESQAKFTGSKQSSGTQTPHEGEDPPLNPEATDSFPPGLFRVPVPDRVFSEMASLSDAALRCLLGLIHLSWRFDPEESAWVHTGEWLMRADVQDECGLSDQGTREGLSDLEKQGLAEVDRSGRSYQYKLQMEVPTRRFTYLPTSLFEKTSATGSATALRVLLAVFRATWGWTESEPDPETGGSQTVHQRWVRLSKADLAEVTGHSDTAITRAVKTLEGTWLARSRPDGGAHFYRVLPGAFGPKRGKGRGKEEDSPNAPTANTVAPYRQHSCPPTSYRERSFRDKHSGNGQKQKGPPGSKQPEPSERSGDAVPEDESSQGDTTLSSSDKTPQDDVSTDPDSSDLPPRKQTLAQKLVNVGVWPKRAKECIERYSAARIEANFQLYRERAPEIDDDGAWLCAAITDGYALPSSDPTQEASSSTDGSLPPLGHKETVSEAKKEAYIAQGVDEDRFHRCLSSQKQPNEPRFMYFDPTIGEPTRQGGRRPA